VNLPEFKSKLLAVHKSEYRHNSGNDHVPQGKSKGPNTEPCGTPYLTHVWSDTS